MEDHYFILAGEGTYAGGRRWCEYVCWGCLLHFRVTFAPCSVGEESSEFFSDIVGFRLISYDGTAAIPKRPACVGGEDEDDDEYG